MGIGLRACSCHRTRVAIDSVCYDFLLAEWPNVVNSGDSSDSSGLLQGGAEDYLYEAAQANNPPSGTFYDPGKTGTRLASLGVHEHWDSPATRNYSRNLDPVNGTGIELVQLTATKPPATLAITEAAGQALVSMANLAAWIQTANCDQSELPWSLVGRGRFACFGPMVEHRHEQLKRPLAVLSAEPVNLGFDSYGHHRA